MIDVEYLSRLYAEKLLATNDHQAAFLKAVWVAYQHGLADKTEEINNENQTMAK